MDAKEVKPLPLSTQISDLAACIERAESGRNGLAERPAVSQSLCRDILASLGALDTAVSDAFEKAVEQQRLRDAAGSQNKNLRKALSRLLSALDESGSDGFMAVVNAKAAARAALARGDGE